MIGYYPMEYNVIVRPLDVAKQTKGGIFLPEDVQDRDRAAQTKGVLVAVSDMAFKNPDRPEGARLPQIGDTVSYARYAGASSKITGADGVEYAILKDNDITAIVEDTQ